MVSPSIWLVELKVHQQLMLLIDIAVSSYRLKLALSDKKATAMAQKTE